MYWYFLACTYVLESTMFLSARMGGPRIEETALKEVAAHDE